MNTSTCHEATSTSSLLLSHKNVVVYAIRTLVGCILLIYGLILPTYFISYEYNISVSLLIESGICTFAVPIICSVYQLLVEVTTKPKCEHTLSEVVQRI